MRTRNRLQSLGISDRVALGAMLALGLSALASLPFEAQDVNGVAADAAPAPEVAARPAPAPVEEAAAAPRFRLLLLRRG